MLLKQIDIGDDNPLRIIFVMHKLLQLLLLKLQIFCWKSIKSLNAYHRHTLLSVCQSENTFPALCKSTNQRNPLNQKVRKRFYTDCMETR